MADLLEVSKLKPKLTLELLQYVSRTVADAYETHSVNKPYGMGNWKESCFVMAILWDLL